MDDTASAGGSDEGDVPAHGSFEGDPGTEAPDPVLTLRRLTRDDFALLAIWLARPHVARWWNHETSPQAVERNFGPGVDGTEPGDVFIASLHGRPVGLVQRYAFGDYPDYQEELAPVVAVPPEAFSIDYLIGEPDWLGRGLGAALIRAVVASIWRDFPSTPAVVVPVVAANVASWRALERAGFRQMAQGRLAPDNPVDGWEHFVYRTGATASDAAVAASVLPIS